MDSPLVIIAPSDRDSSMRLSDEKREEVVQKISEYISERGYVNIAELCRRIALSRPTIEIIVSEIIQDWTKDDDYQLSAQLKWYEKQLREVDEHPETFNVKTKMEAIQMKAAIFKEMNTLRALKDGAKTSRVFNAAISLWKSELRPRTRRILEEKYAGSPEPVSAH